MGILSEICNDNGITLHYATDAVISAIGCRDGLKSGFCTNIGGKNRIFLPENSSHYGKVYVGAHELAHLLLGHIDSDCPASNLPAEVQEDEANSFAGAFLALYLMEQYSTPNRKEEEQVDTGTKQFMTIREVARTGLISEHYLRLREKQHRLPCVYSGKKCLVNYPLLVEQLNAESAAAAGKENAPTGGPNLQ